jgi:hypothetical protein
MSTTIKQAWNAYRNRTYKQGPEEREMVAFFDFCRLRANQDPRLSVAYHTPNEGKSSIQRRMTMQKAGVLAGVPDICVPIPSGKYAALYIELKIKPNKPSEKQKRVIEQLNANGCLAVVCYSASEAIQTLENYLALQS